MANSGTTTFKLVLIRDPSKQIFQGESYILLAATVRQDVRAAKVEGGRHAHWVSEPNFKAGVGGLEPRLEVGGWGSGWEMV